MQAKLQVKHKSDDASRIKVPSQLSRRSSATKARAFATVHEGDDASEADITMQISNLVARSPPEHDWLASSQVTVSNDAIALQLTSTRLEDQLPASNDLPADSPRIHWLNSHDVVTNGHIQGRKIGNVMQFWTALGMSDSEVAAVISRGHIRPACRAFLKQDSLTARLNSLSGALLSVETTIQAVRACPDILLVPQDRCLQSLHTLQTYLGPRKTCALILEHPKVLTCSVGAVAAWMTEQFGDNTTAMLVQSPILLTRKVSDIAASWAALTTEQGAESETFKTNPCVFNHVVPH